MDDTQIQETVASIPPQDEAEIPVSPSRRAAAIEAAYILEAVRK